MPLFIVELIMILSKHSLVCFTNLPQPPPTAHDITATLSFTEPP